MSYCSEKHSDGWLCVLRRGHEGAHLSIDNSRAWKGTPGFPIIWEPELTREQTDELKLVTDPTLTQGEVIRESMRGATGADVRMAQNLGYTGELCGHCGSPNTIRIGKCVRCDACGQDGECG
jgi:hypothetical protein